jgi:FkbM family methyltransferase
MNTWFPSDYDHGELRRITTSRFGFDLWVTPRFGQHYADGTYEEMTALLVRQIVRRAACFIDVGAHFGFYSVLAGLSNPNCAIFAFEPVAENAEILRMNLDLHGIESDVLEVALSDGSGRVPFQVSCASDNSGFFANPKGGVLKTVDIETGLLDEYRDRIPEGPVVVKIDTEGHEPSVLAGMKELLREREDIRLVVEFNPACLEANGFLPEQFFAMIDDARMEMFFVDDDAMIFERYRIGESWEPLMRSRSFVNVVCVPRDLALSLCVFSHSSGLEGAERSLLELVDALVAERGDLCTVVLPSAGPLIQLLNDRGAATLVVDLEWWCAEDVKNEEAIRQQMARSCSRIVRLAPFLAKLQPDVVVTNTLVVPWGAVAATMLNLPHIWWVKEFGELDHDLKFFLDFDRVIEAVEFSSTHVVVTSRAVKDALFGDVDTGRCTVAYNDRITFAGDPVTGQSYFHRPMSTKILFVGRATIAKGLDDAIHATSNLLDRGYDVELCVVGKINTPFGQEMQRLTGDLDLDERVRFTGFVHNVHDVMEQADVVIMCSKREAFGRVTAEAMLLGKPIIATNTGGTVELVDDGVTGFLYQPGDFESLAERICRFVENPKLVCDFGDRARSAIVRKLRDRPVSGLMHALCLQYKGTTNSSSPGLLTALLEWQTGWVEDLGNRVNQLTEQVSLNNEKLRGQEIRLTENESELENARARERELKAILLARDNQVESLEIRATTLNGQILELNAELGLRREQLEKFRAELAGRDEQVESLDAQSKALERQIETQQVELFKREEQIDVLHRRLSDIIASKAWRVANILWRIRILLVPPGSLRARMLSRLGI